MLPIAICAAVVWTSACASPSPKPQLSPQAPAQLSASPAQVAFGDVSLGSKNSKDISVSNTGNFNLTVSQATVSGSGFGLSGLNLPLTVLPGNSAAFTVSFAPAKVGSANGALSLVSNSPNSPNTIALSADGVTTPSAQVSVIPGSVSFGSVTIGTTNTQAMTVSNPGSASLSVSQALVSGNGFALKGLNLPLTVLPGSSAIFTVSFAPTAASSATGSLALVSNAPTSPTAIPLSGTGAAVSVQLGANPTSVSFGNVNVGSKSSKTVTLTNSGNSSVTVSQLAVAGSGFTASGLTTPMNLAAGQSATFNVGFAPTTGGTDSGNVSVASSATSSPQIALSGSGVQPVTSSGPLPAFPGAQGGGARSVGGRGGTVYEVTNLNDGGAGSLRACVQASGSRTCVFRAGGTIVLASALIITNPYITIAGQTAPGGGIQIVGTAITALPTHTLQINTHDVIVRYLRLRPGHNSADGSGTGDGSSVLIGNYGDGYNVIVDHCSLELAHGEAYATWSNDTSGKHNQTLSWSIAGLVLGDHPTSILTGASSLAGSASMTDIDFHHNMIAVGSHRNPLIKHQNGRFINNLLYDWYYYGSLSGGGMSVDYINNIYKAGPMFTGVGSASSWEITAYSASSCTSCGPSGTPSIYMTGNIGPNDPSGTNNAANLFRQDSYEGPGTISTAPSGWVRSTPQATPSGGVAIPADSTTNLVSEVLSSVGAYQKLNDTACDGSFVSNRDALDDLMITYYNNGTGPTQGTAYGGGFVPATQADVGGIPTLAAGTACTSSLHDGLNDQWKVNHGLSVTDPTLYQTVAPNGYTYLENYLNGTAPN